MTRIKQFFSQFESRTILIGFAVLLLVLNLGRMAVNFYLEKQEETVNKVKMLSQYREQVEDLNLLKIRVAALERQRKQLDRYFLSGKSEEDISSALQIMLQEMVVKSGLQPEFIRPSRSGGISQAGALNEITVNLRMAGTMQEFITFTRDLYRAANYFKIESLSIKPFKEAELKIVMEVNGFYKLL
jgi:Tfp pilus assembly protein PilO